MTASFFHGVSSAQIPTSLVAPRRSISALPIVFGCAPIHRLAPEDQAKVAPGKIAIVYTMTEAGTMFGIDVQRDDFENWTLSEFAYSEFSLFAVAPMVFCNLFDPATHKKSIASEAVAFAAGVAQLLHPDVIGGVILTPTGGGEPYVAGVDYALNAVTGAITVLEDGALASVTAATAAYSYAAPELVTSEDCIGGYDIVTGVTTGIALADDVFPRFRQAPAIGVAPKFGEDPVVAAILASKMASVNGILRGVAICDIPSDGENGVARYSEVPEYKQRNNLVSEDLYLCWPKIKLGDRVMRMSTQAASLLARVDADNGGIPYVSPSNKNLQMTSCVAGGGEVWLSLEQANYLNANGIATALNFVDGWKLWGNRTACYPDNTDPKDTFITARRMLAWFGNRLTLQWWQKVDFPMTRRLVLTIVNTEQIYLNALTAQGVLHGGRIAFVPEENSILDLMDGKIAFHIFLGLVPPAEHIHFNLEYDPDYVQTLFAAIAAA